MTEITYTTSGFRDLERCMRDRHVALDPATGELSLSRHISLRDEVGRCHYRDREVITDRVWARKQFVVADPDVRAATLAINLSCEAAVDSQTEGDSITCADTKGARLLIDVNGHTVEFPWPKTSTYWQGPAFEVPIPVESLRQGLNDVVLRSDDATEWYLLIEDSLWPNRSARSVDGGRTWDDAHLGPSGGHDGEYLVRLELEGHPSRGTVESPAIDLACVLSGSRIGVPFQLVGLTLERDAEIPEGTEVEFEVRAGPTPSHDPERWSAWAPRFPPDELSGGTARFVQWRATLLTRSPRSTPRLRSVTVIADVVPESSVSPGSFRIVYDNSPTIARSAYHFAHQAHDEPRVHIARERWALDEVVAGAGDELEAIARLADWTRHQWEDGWNQHSGLHGGELRYCPPWDGLVIRELASRDLSLGMCTHYATVFVQAATAIGFVARHNVIQGHCVAEVWVNDWQKWVMFDPGGDTDDTRKGTYHKERHGVPMSALEAHRAWVRQDFAGVKMVPAIAETKYEPDKWLKHFERFCVTLREDNLTSVSAGEPEHGWGPYHFDGYLWWEDEATPKLAVFTLATGREADMYWGVNQVAVHLAATGVPDALAVTLETVTPNLDHLEVRLQDGAWEATPQEFVWRLGSDENHLRVRSVNRFGRRGPIASVAVQALDA